MSDLAVTIETVRMGQVVRDRVDPYREGEVVEVGSWTIVVLSSGWLTTAPPEHWTHVIPPCPDLGTGADGRERRARWRDLYEHLPGAGSAGADALVREIAGAPPEAHGVQLDPMPPCLGREPGDLSEVCKHLAPRAVCRECVREAVARMSRDEGTHSVDHPSGNPSAPLDLAEARRLAQEAQDREAKATPGPWYLDEDGEVMGAFCPIRQGPANIGPLDFDANDEAFVLSARTDVPALAALVQQMADEIERLRAEVSELQRDERSFLNEIKSALRGPSRTGNTSPFAEHAGRRVRRIMDGRTGIVTLFGPDQVPHILLEGSGKNGFEGPALPADPAAWYLVSEIEPVPISDVPSPEEGLEVVRRLGIDLDKFTSDLKGLAARESQPAMARGPEQPICLCTASSEYDPPCPRHGILGIGVTGRS